MEQFGTDDETVEEIIINNNGNVLEQINLFPKTAKIPRALFDAFLALPVTSKILQLLEMLILKDRVDVTEAFLAYSLRLQDEWDFYAIALCLRNGVSTNIYIIDQVTGESSHILVSVLVKHLGNPSTETIIQENSLLWKFVLLLNVFDLDTDLPLKGLSSNPDSFSSSQTVKFWLSPFSEVFKKIPKDIASSSESDKFYYIALSGKTENYKDLERNIQVTETQYRFLVKSRTYAILKDYISLRKVVTKVEIDSVIPVLALQCYDESALLDYNKYIALMSYPLTNELCLRAIDKGVLGKIWSSTLISCIKEGLPVDLHQYEILSQNPSLLQHLLKAYEKPYWKKYLNASKEGDLIPSRVYELAVAVCGIHFDSDLENLYQTIENTTSSMSHKELEKALTKRERLRIIANQGCLNSVVSYDETEDIELVPLTINQNEYRLLSVELKTKGDRVSNPFILLPEYYVMFTNKGNLYIVYSFDYRRIDLIPEFEQLPEFAKIRMINKIERNLRIIQDKGEDPNKPRTYLDVIKKETTRDEISNRISDIEMSQFYVTLEGILDKNISVKNIYQGIYNLQDLTEDHARVTIAYIYNNLHSLDLVKWKKLDEQLSLLIKS